MLCSSVYESPVGRLRVIEKDGFIIRVFFDNGTAENYASCSPSAITEKTVSRLEEYFLGKRRDFDLPLSFAAATPFRQNVWNELLKIPYGSKHCQRTYCYRFRSELSKHNPHTVF